MIKPVLVLILASLFQFVLSGLLYVYFWEDSLHRRLTSPVLIDDCVIETWLGHWTPHWVMFRIYLLTHLTFGLSLTSSDAVGLSSEIMLTAQTMQF